MCNSRLRHIGCPPNSSEQRVSFTTQSTHISWINIHPPHIKRIGRQRTHRRSDSLPAAEASLFLPPTYNYMSEAKEPSSLVVVEGGRGSLSPSWRCICIFAGISFFARPHLDASARGMAMGQRLKRYKTRLWIFSCMFVFFGVAGAATPLQCWTRGNLLLEYKLCAMHA